MCTIAMAESSGKLVLVIQRYEYLFQQHSKVVLFLCVATEIPSFKITGYSRADVPDITVEFSNGVKDDLLLEPYSKSPCNFLGKLKNSEGSVVAVTGCLTNPEDKLHITLFSPLNTKSAMYEMDFYGHTTALENPFKYQKG